MGELNERGNVLKLSRGTRSGGQIGRLKKETEGKRLRGMKIGMVHTRGRMDEGMVTCALEELANLDEKPKEVVIGLPVNCLVVHGNDGARWFGPERKAVIRKNLVTGGSEWSAEYVPHDRTKKNHYGRVQGDSGQSGKIGDNNTGNVSVGRAGLRDYVPKNVVS